MVNICQLGNSDRLLAVPFWIVERACEIAKRKKLERTSGWELGESQSLLVFFLLAPVFRSAISCAFSTIQKGTASSLQQWQITKQSNFIPKFIRPTQSEGSTFYYLDQAGTLKWEPN